MRIRKHKDIATPHGNKIVWRYMGLDKFLDLAINQRLYFANAGKLSDQYEVTLPPYTLKEHENELRAKGISGDRLADELQEFEKLHKPLRDQVLVNCWSLGRHESYALWKIYLEGARTGVAIRTSVSNLRDALTHGGDPEPESLYLAQVEYGDYLPDEDVNAWTLVSRKRNFYTYENELRLFILRNGKVADPTRPPAAARFVRVDLDRLIDRIYLSPFAGPWFRKTFERTLKKLNPKLVGRLETSLIRDH